MVPVTYNPQNHVEVLLDLIGQKSRPRLRSAVRSQSDIGWLCHGSAYRKTSYTASGHQLPPHKRRLTRAKSIWWQLVDIVDMISIIMFDMSTHDFACRQEHYILLWFPLCVSRHPGTYFTKGLWAHDWNLVKIIFCPNHKFDRAVMP